MFANFTAYVCSFNISFRVLPVLLHTSSDDIVAHSSSVSQIKFCFRSISLSGSFLSFKGGSICTLLLMTLWSVLLVFYSISLSGSFPSFKQRRINLHTSSDDSVVLLAFHIGRIGFLFCQRWCKKNEYTSYVSLTQPRTLTYLIQLLYKKILV